MTLETLSSSEISNFLIYDTAPPDSYYLHPSAFNFVVDSDDLCGGGGDVAGAGEDASERKKRRRRTRSSKNKEEAENQRMTHIAVERNRRRQMNEHLSVLRSLMPDSYVQRGDQASIVGGAIDFVKELEQLLQSLETQKRRLQEVTNKDSRRPTTADGGRSPPFSQFFTYPQYTWCQAPREKQTTEKHNQLHPTTTTSMADIEVTIIEKHTNLRILTHKRPGHLLKLVSGLEALHLAILHINATTLDPMALYSISAKVEEGCNLTTVDDIAAAVHRMLSQMEDEATATATAKASAPATAPATATN